MTGLEKLRKFARSPHHAWLFLLTAGAGLASVSPLGIILGLAAYGLGWVYLPDARSFLSWLAKKSEAEKAPDMAAQKQFLDQRKALHDSLGANARADYAAFAAEAEELMELIRRDANLTESAKETRATRVGQLAWTFLRLLHTCDVLERLLGAENPDQVAQDSAELEHEIANLQTRAASTDISEAHDAQRLLDSKSARLDTLRQRQAHLREAISSLHLAMAEKERILDLLKLLRADHLASRTPESISSEIDAVGNQLERTTSWLKDLEFDRSPANIPAALTATSPLRVDA